MSSSSLSTKARIATDMAKGPLSFSQPKPKYQGLTMRKSTTLPGEARSPVTPSTANPRSPLDSPQHASLLRSSNELNNQTQMKAASLPQRSPPPPQLEGLSLDPEPDRMDVDQHVFINFPHCHYSSNPLQPVRLHLLNRRILRQRKIYYTP